MMHVYALCRSGIHWSCRRITGIMAVGFLSAMSAGVVIIYESLEATTTQVIYNPLVDASLCAISGIPKYVPLFFVPMATLELVLGGLATYTLLRNTGLRSPQPSLTFNVCSYGIRPYTLSYTLRS
ncbi:hypothetical protein HETIRDRAFT_422770 [Heterobasidion irregulare TC 32-1]|uniref:Uncharacterized protein n=1 Tax=Heterobasidion irregulare (strain TC 32-1) TaxID=747525 RepID=W4JTI4_HETIT|nr:uncharacterized protein HETIRDRAFT_422770 [Heterobasidion irregulare TC 32-1]ETW76206.1 hypothetical protein HETIRDRAFT_422770 [Heterobasidion irregulare TC 32-1]